MTDQHRADQHPTDQHPTGQHLTARRPGSAGPLVVINRWREHYAEYAEYVDHAQETVCYISTEVGLGSVPTGAAGVELVDATDDLEQVRAAFAHVARVHGVPRAVVALKEDDLLVAAALREEWDLPGPRTETLLPFRDKLVMSRTVRAHGLDVPAAAPAECREAVLEAARTHGWPLVLKPRCGSSSEGVAVVRSEAELDALAVEDAAWGPGRLVQAFDARPIHHVDGLFDGSTVVTARVSRYVNTCLGFRDGTVLGSVEIDDDHVAARVVGAATDFLRALSDAPTPFHLEVFVGDDGTVGFLEVGARVGGAEVSLLWRDLHGVDLMAAAFALQAGTELPDLVTSGTEVGGWLLVPAPAERPCRVTRSTDLLGEVEHLYAQVRLDVGDVLPDAAAYYEHVGGRFRFRAPDTSGVERAIAEVAARFEVEAESLHTAPLTGALL